MLDDFHKALEDLQHLTGSNRQYAIVWLLVWCLLFIVRYAITGVVVFMLGQRIINAFAFALRESQKKDD